MAHSLSNAQIPRLNSQPWTRTCKLLQYHRIAIEIGRENNKNPVTEKVITANVRRHLGFLSMTGFTWVEKVVTTYNLKKKFIHLFVRVLPPFYMICSQYMTLLMVISLAFVRPSAFSINSQTVTCMVHLTPPSQFCGSLE